MLLKGAKLQRLVLAMIRQHAPAVAPGAGVVVRKTGKTYEVALPAETLAKLAALPDPGITYGSASAANLGPPPPIVPPPIPRLGP